MANRLPLVASLSVLALMACNDADAGPKDASAAVVRTGDPYQRGLTDEDFPRIQKLAEGVYSYEQLRWDWG